MLPAGLRGEGQALYVSKNSKLRLSFRPKRGFVQFYRAHKAFPFDVSPSSTHRWAYIGINTPNGRIRLETAVCGNKRFTSLEAIERFLREQQGETDPQSNVGAVPTSGGMSKQALKKEMQRLGLRQNCKRGGIFCERMSGGRKPSGLWQYATFIENFNTFFGSPCIYTCISPKPR